MRNCERTGLVLAATAFATAVSLAGAGQAPAARWSPPIPRTWDREAMQNLEVPLAVASASPRHVSAEYY
jgi:hypothetical protein